MKRELFCLLTLSKRRASRSLVRRSRVAGRSFVSRLILFDQPELLTERDVILSGLREKVAVRYIGRASAGVLLLLRKVTLSFYWQGGRMGRSGAESRRGLGLYYFPRKRTLFKQFADRRFI